MDSPRRWPIMRYFVFRLFYSEDVEQIVVLWVISSALAYMGCHCNVTWHVYPSANITVMTYRIHHKNCAILGLDFQLWRPHDLVIIFCRNIIPRQLYSKWNQCSSVYLLGYHENSIKRWKMLWICRIFSHIDWEMEFIRCLKSTARKLLNMVISMWKSMLIS